MDEIASKAIIIGVSIFVTLIIITVLIFEFTQIKDIYRVTAETDVTFEAKLNEFDKYRDSNNYFNGLDVKNTIEKYKNDDTVDVCIKLGEETTCNDYVCEDIGGINKCRNTIIIPESDYTKQYIVSFDDEALIYKIIFEKIGL